MPAAHDVYAEQLYSLGRGHALYYPEPTPGGEVEIGDVGYIQKGAFVRLFNASRPADDPSQPFGVPNGFVQLDTGVIHTYTSALEPGPLHSRTITDCSGEVGTIGEILPAGVKFRFRCASRRGAILVLETQMIRQTAIQHLRFESYLLEHCDTWHAFARSHDIDIGFADLMLVTECSKTAAWSSVVYSSSSNEFGLGFSVGSSFTTAGVSASHEVAQIGPVERRRSQRRALLEGPPLPKNHTVFIQAYRLGVRQRYKHSVLSLFLRNRGQGIGGSIEQAREVGLRSVPTARRDQPGFTETVIMRPYDSDFSPTAVLLGLKFERDKDAEYAVVHDSVLLSADVDSEESRIIRKYAEFFFHEEDYTSETHMANIIDGLETPREHPSNKTIFDILSEQTTDSFPQNTDTNTRRPWARVTQNSGSKIEDFKCEYEGCMCTFTDEQNLRDHMVSHVGVNPYECLNCGQRFPTQGTYSRHNRECTSGVGFRRRTQVPNDFSTVNPVFSLPPGAPPDIWC